MWMLNVTPHLRIKCRLLVSSWEGTASTQLLPEEPFSVVQDVPCMWGDVIAGCASAHLGFEVLWVLAKKSIMGIKTLKAKALSPHIWEQDWWWVCFIACKDYTEGLKLRPHPTWPYRPLPLPSHMPSAHCRPHCCSVKIIPERNAVVFEDLALNLRHAFYLLRHLAVCFICWKESRKIIMKWDFLENPSRR